MNLPIDARNAPFKEKYIDEETPMFRRWFIFGHREGHPELVDINDGVDDVIIIGMPLGEAILLCEARNAFVARCVSLTNHQGV